MACFWLKPHATFIKIPNVKEVSGIIFYNIEIFVDDVKWTVLHRYSEFFDLHSHLVNEHGVSRDLLPAKKVIMNKSPQFVENRRIGLEAYLQKVLNFLKLAMPRMFIEFLNFHLYDVFFLLQNLSLKFLAQAERILSPSNSYVFNALEVHAISKCYKTPILIENSADNRYNLSHVLDLCSQLNVLTIEGLNEMYFTSNIVPNNLDFDLTSFKNVTTVIMTQVALDRIKDVGNFRKNLNILIIHRTNMVNICQILQCDIIHKYSFTKSQEWLKLTEIDLSNNNLVAIDESLRLVPNLQILSLNQNKISGIPDLSYLTRLTMLSLCGNLITACSELHTKLGNILHLSLAQNNISVLNGLIKLYSLQSLDLSHNQIESFNEIKSLSDLPCLECLNLAGNLVSNIVDFRIKVFEEFDERAKEVTLDSEKATQSELDKVLVFKALHMINEGKTPDILK